MPLSDIVTLKAITKLSKGRLVSESDTTQFISMPFQLLNVLIHILIYNLNHYITNLFSISKYWKQCLHRFLC